MGTERIRRVVDGFKLFASHEVGAATQVDVHAVLEQSITLAGGALSPGIQLVRELQPVPPVWASEHGLGQIFLNLLINAAQALESRPAGPRIRVATGLSPDGQVWVEIQDNGPGIAPQHMKRLFEPFFTTKPAGKGAGLGLSICHGLITSFGGDIRVSSTPGQGTAFRVLLRHSEG
jgi:C4-dicarboxylate-specific signal transduction histidine kinase